ncbi:MAG: hypothetical protein DMG58_30670 [Acidobacteria bacterium]|nr:MAG: hypothetical protein DMG58_30670 [Acidobacteriota bacterium]
MAEELGALGLMLPVFCETWRGLTTLAAAGLVIIINGATTEWPR